MCIFVTAYGLLQKEKLFSLSSNNAILEFILHGSPLLRENYLDARKVVDKQLKNTCEAFIFSASDTVVAPLTSFMQQVKTIFSCIIFFILNNFSPLLFLILFSWNIFIFLNFSKFYLNFSSNLLLLSSTFQIFITFLQICTNFDFFQHAVLSEGFWRKSSY